MIATQKRLQELFATALRKKLPKTLAVISISGKKSRQLNRRYRKKNKPANVLSFRYGKEYGEILLCTSVIRKEAKAQRNSYQYQVTWTILHGMLHLAGLHHEKSAAKARLTEKVERSVLLKLFPRIKY